MTIPPCLRLADDIFPRVRVHVARALVQQGWSQSRVGEALGVSQAMVSKYTARQPPGPDPLVDRLARDFLQELENPQAGLSPWCQTLSIGEQDQDRREALEDLLAAEGQLLEQPPLNLVPQIGLNIVRALPDAGGADDVLSFPGRLVRVGDRLVNPAPPTFGASGHLARCLLELRRHNDMHPLAMANVRGGSDVAAAADRMGLEVAQLKRKRGEEDADGPFLRSAAGAKGALHDPGAFGIEPCLYIPGANANTVAATIRRLAEELET